MNTQPLITSDYRLKGVRHVAKRLGVSPTTISRVVRGERKPGPKLARRLAKLGIEVPQEVASR